LLRQALELQIMRLLAGRNETLAAEPDAIIARQQQ
jgi:hypothetical protein